MKFDCLFSVNLVQIITKRSRSAYILNFSIFDHGKSLWKSWEELLDLIANRIGKNCTDIACLCFEDLSGFDSLGIRGRLRKIVGIVDRPTVSWMRFSDIDCEKFYLK